MSDWAALDQTASSIVHSESLGQPSADISIVPSRSDIDGFAREGLRRGEARRRLRANPKAFRVLTFPHALYYLHRLNVPLDRAWPPEPIEELRGRVGLVVMLAVEKDGKFVEIFGEPWRGFRDVDKTILDHAGLRVHAHRLFAG